MKNMMFYAITLFCALLYASCESNKKGKDTESTLPAQEEESLNQEEEALTLKEQLNLIDYDLDLPQGIMISRKNGFHLLVPDTTHNEDVDSASISFFDVTVSVSDEGLRYRPEYGRFVLLEGEYVMYNPNILINDLALIGIKEAVIWLSYMKMYTNDPRIRKLGDEDDICSEALYYLLSGDEEVRQDIKKIAEEHYQAVCNSYEEQGELKKVLNSSGLKLCFELSQYTAYSRYIIIYFNFDDNGYLHVRSSLVDDSFDLSNEFSWDFRFPKLKPEK